MQGSTWLVLAVFSAMTSTSKQALDVERFCYAMCAENKFLSGVPFTMLHYFTSLDSPTRVSYISHRHISSQEREIPLKFALILIAKMGY